LEGSRINWWKYLRKAFDIKPSGSRHLRKLVVRLKFEPGIPIGLAIRKS
jgi:hypothetical protein